MILEIGLWIAKNVDVSNLEDLRLSISLSLYHTNLVLSRGLNLMSHIPKYLEFGTST